MKDEEVINGQKREIRKLGCRRVKLEREEELKMFGNFYEMDDND